MSQTKLRRTAMLIIARPPAKTKPPSNTKPKPPGRLSKTILIVRRPSSRLTVVLGVGR